MDHYNKTKKSEQKIGRSNVYKRCMNGNTRALITVGASTKKKTKKTRFLAKGNVLMSLYSCPKCN